MNLKKIIDLIAEQAAREAGKAPEDPPGGVILMLLRCFARARRGSREFYASPALFSFASKPKRPTRRIVCKIILGSRLARG